MAWTELIAFAYDKVFRKPLSHAFDSKYFDKKVVKDVHNHLLKKYGNEVYYNALDGYLTANHVIELLITSIRGESNVQSCVADTFKGENIKKFLDHNPEFKSNKVVSSKVLDIFGEIFDIVYAKVIVLDSHSDLGKLQRTVQSTGESLSEDHQRMDSKLENIEKTIFEIQSALPVSGISDTSIEKLGASSEIIDSYTKRIKEIETENQNKHQYRAALTRYYALLQEVVTKLVGVPTEQVNELICTINCNIALCQSNLGLDQEAFNSLSAIPNETALKSKAYHYVYALVHIHQNDVDSYQVALGHINIALQIDANYHNAFSFKQYLRAHIYPDQIKSILEDIDEHYSHMVEKGVEDSKLAEHYQFRGLINLYADRYADAIEDFQQALKYGCEPMTIKLNIAVAMYAEASKEVPKDCRLLAPRVDQKIMMKAVDALKEIIDLTERNTDFENVRKRAVAIYISACSAIGKKHGLSPINGYIYEGQDYEELRGLLLGASEKATEEQLSLLSPDDRLFFDVRELMEQNDAETCRNYIAGIVDKKEQKISPSVYHILLQVCLITEDSNSYWKYRRGAADYGIVGELLDSMDACAYEIGGEVVRAKEIFDRLASSSKDDCILENVLRFFLRNEYTHEARMLFSHIHEMIVSKSIYMKNVEAFYREAARFFIEDKDDTIQNFLLELPDGIVSPRCMSQLLALFYSATNDSENLYKCLVGLDCARGEFTNAFNMALCAARLFKYDEALDICYDLEKRMSGIEEKVKLCWLISDILLLTNDEEGSFNWAKKAHELTKENPYDRSHQAYFSRAFRCNHHEALGDIVEYQKVHPVVVNWVKAFSIREDDEDILSTLKNAIEEFDPGHDDYEKREESFAKLYRQGLVPISAVYKRYEGDFWRLFDFALKNKLNIALGHPEELRVEFEKIGNVIVTDALTLVLMAYHDCLNVLNAFETVYINCSSVATVQRLYLSYGHPSVSEVLSWLEAADNIVFRADGFVDQDNQVAKLFSEEFVSCCNIAADINIPFLYCDVLARKLQVLPESGPLVGVDFVSIPSVCNKILEEDPQRLSDVLYSLLKTSTFISFRAETILYQIRKHNYEVSKELLAPFMFCNTTCNMQTFTNVYLTAIKALCNEKSDAAEALACIVLEDALRIWRQGTYYRFMQEDSIDLELAMKAAAITRYVREVLQGIKRIFGDMKGALAEHFDVLVAATEEVVSD